ncbi:S1C family serine protease [Siccirubricoccus phaeus]|uniref:S1C family serine protease n=1 Tax=Siccirubricoccus phaeus TaxID=2595053 RepID=UPI00165B6B5C|nr:S1C family serine protease [Siccirubricoccus phaeus]
MSDLTPFAALSRQLAAFTAAAAARTCLVHGRDGRARAGLIWAEDQVVTAEEALERDDDLAVTLPDGRQVPASLAGRDPGTDLALLRAATGAPAPLDLAPAEGLEPGHLVLAIGRGEYGPVAARALVAELGGPWRSLRGGRLERRIRLDIKLDPAAEGGAVLDHEGRLLGMAVPGPRRRALVVPVETISRVVPLLAAEGRIARGYLGLALQPVRLEEAPGRGLIAVGVDPRSPAGEAGILLGDVLLAWDGMPLASVREMLARLDPESVGRTVVLDLLRGGQKRQARVTIRARAAA